jgi:hypothetical protein
MATTPIPVLQDRQAVQYTGTNAAEIAALISDFTVTGETATTLSFTSLGVPYTVARNGYITYWDGAVRETPFNTEDDFRDQYREQTFADHVHELVLRTGKALPATPEDM